MNRQWNINEQTIEEPATKLRFEFTSEHTQAITMGLTPPASDAKLMLRVYNESGTRVIELAADRGGQIKTMTVEPVVTGTPLTDREKAYAEMQAANRANLVDQTQTSESRKVAPDEVELLGGPAQF